MVLFVAARVLSPSLWSSLSLIRVVDRLPNYDYGVEQDIPKDRRTDGGKGIQQWHTKTKDYVRDYVVGNEALQDRLHQCRNLHGKCTEWASRGECNTNPGYMLKDCLPACRMCHAVLPKKAERENETN